MARSSDYSRPLDSKREAELNSVDALAQMSFLIRGMLERHADEEGLSMIQTRLLGILRDRQPTINELARLLELDKSSVSGLVLRAERRGLVARTPSTVDGRSVLVRLSSHGRALVSKVAHSFEADVTALLDPLTSSEGSELRRLLGHVLSVHAAALGVAPSDACGSGP